MPEPRDFCGCCGRPSGNSWISEPWCRDCSGHVLKLGGAQWDRTWFAQTGQECPFQIGCDPPPPAQEVA